MRQDAAENGALVDVQLPQTARTAKTIGPYRACCQSFDFWTAVGSVATRAMIIGVRRQGSFLWIPSSRIITRIQKTTLLVSTWKELDQR